MALPVTVGQHNLTVQISDSPNIQLNKRFMDKTGHTVHFCIFYI